MLRDAVLTLAEHEPFARTLVNSGRLSTPTPYVSSSLNTPDSVPFGERMVPGTPCADAPVRQGSRPGWLLSQLGEGFTVLVFGAGDFPVSLQAAGLEIPVKTIGPAGSGALLEDVQGLAAQRYAAHEGCAYLIRPDQHVAARWSRFDPLQIAAAVNRCVGHSMVQAACA